MYQCCLETEQILKKEKQKVIEDIWTIKAANSDEVENLLKIQVNFKQIFILSINSHLNLSLIVVLLLGYKHNNLFYSLFILSTGTTKK